MNSFAHYAYGAVVGWMFKTLGGISPMEPGYGMVKIAPVPDPNLSFAKTSYKSVRGMIRTHWKRSGKGYELEVVVPPNVTAEVHVPLADGGTRKEIVGSGTWTFKG
jgi:alpha-L-rhamnosidase